LRLVGHRVHLQVTPDVLHGIQLRRIRRKIIYPPIFSSGDILLDTSGAVRQELIPDQNDGTLKMPGQVLEERKNLLSVDVHMGMKAEKRRTLSLLGEAAADKRRWPRIFCRYWYGVGTREFGREEPTSFEPGASSKSHFRQ
jgi:hypothetical protein